MGILTFGFKSKYPVEGSPEQLGAGKKEFPVRSIVGVQPDRHR